MYSIIFYVPDNACELVKQSMFAAGAGAYECYDQCSWQVLGEGQFRPLQGSKPAIGSADSLSHFEEYRVEMLCDERNLSNAIQAMLSTHPYELVAYHVIQHFDVDGVN